MAGLCRGANIGGETETAKPVEPSSQSARRRRMEIHQFRFVASDTAVAPPLESGRRKRQRLGSADVPSGRACDNAVQNSIVDERKIPAGPGSEKDADSNKCCPSISSSSSEIKPAVELASDVPKFGMTSVCGRRRDMEDAVSIHPSFSREVPESSTDLHFYGVFDGHGCSHVAMKCKDRMHEIVKDELERVGENDSWENKMKRSFSRMDEEVTQWSTAVGITSPCRCELRTPQCDAVGSTAVVAVVTPDKIIISNCGDSRAVLGRDGKAVPLSVDHKPDRPDELERIQEAGGRVIYWDGARVLGVLAMSRAIGDNYLKPYVISEPEVTVIDRTDEDDCLILATDGLWDVVSNETACGVARMCLQSLKPPSPVRSPGNQDATTISAARESSDKACSDASILLTKLALARHSTDNVSVVVIDLRKNRS
ncbi:OLC1v1027739C1 [Oldenlandia corymbosa var. corymbosa]|uniref:protein-serine/threonine phosphatase n=1 Tax=Oldenlandia corymbosa var. corymbosa TaxID=529605 RepID=A0AAV1CCE2_OLDCO|nr:OLC1v1027739C1 [Oldenlandia corymbosa var. corymbosa]